MAELPRKEDRPLSEKDLSTLLELLYEAAHKWERIAIFLDFDTGTIANIKSKSGTDEAEDKLLEVMKKWLSRTSPPPTTGTLVEMLKTRFVGEEKLAHDIEKYFTTHSSKPTQRSASYSATQMSAVQADVSRSNSLPSSVTSIATKKHNSVKLESSEQHQPNTRLSLQSPNDRRSASSSKVEYIIVTPKSYPDHNQLSVEEEKIQASIRNNQEAYNHESETTINHTEKTYSFQAALSSEKQLAVQEHSKGPVHLPSTIEPCTLLSTGAGKDSTSSAAAEELKSSYMYGCGCGNCSVIDFVSGKCQKPLPTASTFPFLNTQGMSVNDIRRLSSKLHADFQDIDLKYADLTVDVRKSLESRNITPEELSLVLMDLRVYPHLHDDSQPMFGDRYKELRSAENVGKIFEIMRDYCSFFSHKIIEFIVKKLGTDEDKEKLAQYKRDFREYCKRNVFECPYFSTKSPKFADLVMKVDIKMLKKQYTLETQEEFEDNVVAILGIANHNLKLCSVRDGCLLMTYQIPPAAEDAILSLKPKQIVDLRELGIIHMMCRDIQVLDSQLVTKERAVTSTDKIAVQSKHDIKFSNSRQGDCINYLLEGKCNRKRCSLSHSLSIHGNCVEAYVSISTQVERIKGHTLGQSEKAFLITDSERDPKEAKVIAEDMATLEIAKEVAVQKQPGKQQSVSGTTLPIQTGIMGTHRYCYIHPEGIEQPHLFKFQKSDDEYGEKHELQIVSAEALPGDPIPERTYRVEDFQHLNPEEKSLYYLLENQERVLSRPLEFSLILAYKDYVGDIHKKMQDGLCWMQKNNLQPKLEGRFGKLCWRELSSSIPLPEMEGFDADKFIHMAFETDKKKSRFFYTNISNEGAKALERVCRGKGGLLTEIETYDFKIGTSKEGKLDIRVKFNEGVPEAVRVKKSEYKVAIFDILCLHRHHDMRISLSNYEAATGDHPTVGRFLATLKMERPGVITFVPTSQDKEWTVKFMRHKIRTVHSFNPPNYVISISAINECYIPSEGVSPTLTLDTGKDQPHIEVELHNLLWEVGFGNQLGLSPEQSLALLIEPQKILPSVKEHCPEKWSPEWIMKSFEKDDFIKMMETINQIMKAS